MTVETLDYEDGETRLAGLLARMGRESATSRGGDFGEMLEIFRNLFRRDRQAQTATLEGR